MIKLVEINDSQFANIVLKSVLPVVVEYESPECIICKTMAERLLEVAKEFHTKVIFLRYNINDNKKWRDLAVRVIPTLLYFKDGDLVSRQDSFPETEEIRHQLQSLVK
jgi:thioredoxin 1